MYEVDDEVKDKVEELLVWYGLIDVVLLSDVNKEKVIKDFFVVEVLVMRKIVFDLFFWGFNIFGLGDLFCKYFFIIKFVFFLMEEVLVDKDILKSKLF